VQKPRMTLYFATIIFEKKKKTLSDFIIYSFTTCRTLIIIRVSNNQCINLKIKIEGYTGARTMAPGNRKVSYINVLLYIYRYYKHKFILLFQTTAVGRFWLCTYRHCVCTWHTDMYRMRIGRLLGFWTVIL